jgi:outer membrane protein OmpA-like peptidoglycan-associated protein
MRPLPILVAILALPALVIAHRQYFLATQQGELLARVRASLADPMFSGIKKEDITIDYLDISLHGWVPEPSVREEALRRVATVPGVRCREEDNHLLVTPRLNASFEGEKIALSGWLRDQGIRRDVTRWLQQARPGLEVNTDDIRLSPHVARVDAPAASGAGDTMMPVFAEAWNTIRGRPLLKIVNQGGAFHATGALPSATLRDAVAQAAPGADVTQLRAGSYVRQAKFTHETALPAFLRSLFRSPAVDFFEADGESVRARATATPELEEEWRRLISAIAEDGVGTLELWLVSTTQLLPGYKPESQLAAEVLQTLRAELATTCLHFDSAVHSVSQLEIPCLNTAAQAIIAAGPGARIIVGAHLDAVGDPKLNDDSARRRAASVIGELKSRGVPGTQLEPAVISVVPGPDGGDQSRCVELLVK